MLGNNLFIGIPIGALCCFLFILFCFLNTSKSRAVVYFRLVLGACLVWESGAILMRLQVQPGIHFWYQVSLLGLLFMPVFMYCFLFQTLGMNKNLFLIFYGVISCVVVVINAIWDIVTVPPQAVISADNVISYTYHVTPGTWILVLAEFIVMIYVTVLAHLRIRNDLALRYKLFPLLLGTCCVLVGQIMEMLPGNTVPFGSFGGVLMAVCVVYILVNQCLFDLSDRLIIGCIYTIMAVLIFLPLWFLSRNVEGIMQKTNLTFQNTVVAFGIVLTAWSFLLFFTAQKLIEGMVLKDQKKQFESLQKFQWETNSFLQEEDLFKRTIEAVNRIIENGRALIFTQKDGAGEFELVRVQEADYGLEYEEKQQILQYFHSPDVEQHIEIAPLQYDKKICGFIYIMFPLKVKMNYMEVEYFRQIASFTSICLKNINIYQRAYQSSIHDELTGLYNRRYYKEFIEKYWMPHEPQSIIYLDLDDFRLFNELYGESIADDVLKWCAKIIKEEMDAKGATFRFGSNEFLLYSRYKSEDELVALSETIQKRLMQESEDKPQVLQPITMSIGIALYPDTATDADSLLKQAERANFFAKADGKNCIRVYKVEDKKESVSESSKSYKQIAPTIYALVAAIDAKDSYTFEHSVHVSEYAVLLAQEIGLNESEVQIVREAGMLHDIGKIGIPDNILKKQGRLTNEEYETMKTHVMNSIKMIHYLPNMSYVIPAVVSHHERYDGKGYPRGIAGEEIPLLGRILTVCDCYDAMVSKRAYKEGMPVEYAIAELESNKGTQFDPKLADAFIALIKEGKI